MLPARRHPWVCSTSTFTPSLPGKIAMGTGLVKGQTIILPPKSIKIHKIYAYTYYVHIYNIIYIHICVRGCVYMYMCIYIYIYMCVCVYICVCVCMYVCYMHCFPADVPIIQFWAHGAVPITWCFGRRRQSWLPDPGVASPKALQSAMRCTRMEIPKEMKVVLPRFSVCFQSFLGSSKNDGCFTFLSCSDLALENEFGTDNHIQPENQSRVFNHLSEHKAE